MSNMLLRADKAVTSGIERLWEKFPDSALPRMMGVSILSTMRGRYASSMDVGTLRAMTDAEVKAVFLRTTSATQVTTFNAALTALIKGNILRRRDGFIEFDFRHI